MKKKMAVSLWFRKKSEAVAKYTLYSAEIEVELLHNV